MRHEKRIRRLDAWVVAVALVAGSSAGLAADCGKCDRTAVEKTAELPCPFLGGTEPVAEPIEDCLGRFAGRGHRAWQGGIGSHHETIHGLLDYHDAIERDVVQIDGGVETTTTSADPHVADMIRKHVRDMKQRVESGHGMRWWDPTFSEIFKHHDKIVMQIEDLDCGVRVRETSTDPDIAQLIRQHAIRGVSEFVAEGHRRALQPTPLPRNYGGEKEDPGTR